MKALRIYTLKNQAMADLYFHKHWPRHLVSLPKYQIQVDDVQLEKVKRDDAPCRVFAQVHANAGDDMPSLNATYMKSNEFKEDMAGFPMDSILNVEEVALKDDSIL